MCVEWTGRWHKTTRAITAYKHVSRSACTNDKKFQSPVRLSNRSAQPGYGVPHAPVGGVKAYTLGEVTCSRYPGIFLYRTIVNLVGFKILLKVRIPAGAWIRLGNQCGKPTINATRVQLVSG